MIYLYNAVCYAVDLVLAGDLFVMLLEAGSGFGFLFVWLLRCCF